MHARPTGQPAHSSLVGDRDVYDFSGLPHPVDAFEKPLPRQRRIEGTISFTPGRQDSLNGYGRRSTGAGRLKVLRWRPTR